MRYKKIPGEKGIYEDVKSKKLYCQKRINKKLYSETFQTIKEARNWVKYFNPNKTSVDYIRPDYNEDLNGLKSISFKDVFDLYRKERMPLLEVTTFDEIIKLSSFFEPLNELDVRQITPQVITRLILNAKELYINTGKKKRFNYNHDLSALKAVFNWWKDYYDFKYTNPVIKKIHWPIGVIKVKPKKNLDKMLPSEVMKFINALRDENDKVYALLAEAQFITTTRIQETSCIQKDQINFSISRLVIDRAMAFTRVKGRDNYIKNTKTSEVKSLFFGDRLKNIFLEAINMDKSDFVFSINGKALTYRQIQYHYNKALKKAGLYPRFTSTHIMRHASASAVREGLSLDHSQAMGGWKSSKVAEGYSGISDKYTSEGVNYLEKTLRLIN
jgi:site-specific recombinase XerD